MTTDVESEYKFDDSGSLVPIEAEVKLRRVGGQWDSSLRIRLRDIRDDVRLISVYVT
jgi:hypothetical protein